MDKNEMNYPDFEKFTLYDESIVTIATNTSSPIVETFNTKEKWKQRMYKIKSIKLSVYNNKVVVKDSHTSKVLDVLVGVENDTIEGLLKMFINYNVVDINYPNQDVKQEALIKPIILKNIQDGIRKDL